MTLPLAFAALITSSECLAADPVLKPLGSSYIVDTFDDVNKSNTVWYYASCNQTPHMSADRKFKLFGTAARPGYCAVIPGRKTISGIGTNAYMRFITMPFDRRDAEVVFDSAGNVVSDNYASTVDVRKGGSEMRGNVTRYTYPGTNGQGWDHNGVNFLNPNNTVQYSWKFRLPDLSIFRPNRDGVKPAAGAFVGQFHSQSAGTCNVSAPYESGFSPSPGLEVKLIDATSTTPEQVQFSLRVALKRDQIPAGAEQCPEGKEQCGVILWTNTFPTSQVSTVPNVSSAPWITVSYVMRNAKDSRGAMRFYFGIEGSSDPKLAFNRRGLAGENATTKTLHIPTTQNECPNVPYLGSYVNGYDRLLYGQDIGSTTVDWRIRYNSTWLSSYITGNAAKSVPTNTEYMSYINGTWPTESSPPQLVVDYDDFAITQVNNLPAKP